MKVLIGYPVCILLMALFFAAPGFAQYRYLPLSIPMRDGKFIAADLYAIDTLAAKPTVLIQTPYNKFWYRFNLGNPAWQIPYDSLRYNYLISDWRGFYGSAPAESIGYDRGLDGYDLVEFIASKPWSNGKVGTWGASALGVIQFMTAKHRPPHLTCAVPMVADPKTAYTDYYFGGDYLQELTRMRDSLGFVPESLILAHYKYDVYWWLAELITSYPESINVPVLIITGWYDHNLDSPLQAFYALRDSSDLPVRNKHKILIGPWTHGGLGRLAQGELSYPAAVDSVRLPSLRIFDYYLCNINNGYEAEPRVRFYSLGTDNWVSIDDWVSYGAMTDTLFLRAAGSLDPSPPAAGDPPDSFPYDPRSPTPSIGGIRFDPFNNNVVVGPRDQRDSVEARADVRIFTTGILAEPLIFAGAVSVQLYVSSDREDTDMGVRLTDVYPDGRSMLVTEGIRRMRFRNSYGSEEFMVPGDTYSVNIETRSIAYTFAAGHRLRLIVGSSDYPIYHANLNNGESLYVPGDTAIARNKVFHEPGALSAVIYRSRPSGGIADQDHDRRTDGNRVQLCRNTFTIEFFLDRSADVRLTVYDITGCKIATRARADMQPGDQRLGLDLSPFPRGIYFAYLAIGNRPAAVTKIIRIGE